jgi:hypothetical protein
MSYKRQLEPEEIEKIVNKKWKTKEAEPKTLNKAKMDKALANLTGHKTKEGMRKSLRNLRVFVTKEERDEFDKEYGPYAPALINNRERQYFLARRDEILSSGEFDIDPIIDMNFVLMCVIDEIILQRLLQQLASKPTNRTLNKQITDVQTRYRQNMQTLAATRQQRKSAEREGKEQEIGSLAILVKQLYDDKHRNKRIKQLEMYEEEEDELLRQRRLKSPLDGEYEYVVDAEFEDVEDDGQKEQKN